MTTPTPEQAKALGDRDIEIYAWKMFRRLAAIQDFWESWDIPCECKTDFECDKCRFSAVVNGGTS